MFESLDLEAPRSGIHRQETRATGLELSLGHDASAGAAWQRAPSFVDLAVAAYEGSVARNLYASRMNGCSMTRLSAAMNCAPTAPSMAR
jgi:hypothetical protein